MGVDVGVARVARSKNSHDLILELWRQRDIGSDYYGSLVCEWDEQNQEWHIDYKMMADELTLRAGTPTQLGFIYNFDSLSSVLVVVASSDHPTGYASIVRTWEYWDFRMQRRVRTLTDDEISVEEAKAKI